MNIINEINKLKEDKKEYDMEEMNYKNDINMLTNEINNDKNMIEEKNDKIEELKMHIEEIENEIIEKDKELNEYEENKQNEINDLTAKLEQIANEKMALEQQYLEEKPAMEFYIRPNNKGILSGWRRYYEIKWDNASIKDPVFSKVRFYLPLRGAGGLVGLEFVNLEGDSNAKVLKFSKNAPKWRKVCEGSNLFGKCIYNKCQAFKKEVIYRVGINTKFDFNEQKKRNKMSNLQ